MFDRSVLKQRAKSVLAGCYWISFAVALILAFISGETGFSVSLPINLSNSSYQYSSPGVYDTYMHGAKSMAYPEFLPVVAVVLLVVLCVALVAGLALSILVFNPLTVGGKRFFVRAGEGYEVQFSNMGYCFKNGYWNVVKTMFMKKLFIFLWSLIALIPVAIGFGIIFASLLIKSAYTGGGIEWYGLYIREMLNYSVEGNPLLAIVITLLPLFLVAALIPAIIAQYRYYMVEYLLADNPHLRWQDALKQSGAMMQGNKWATFVLELSFLGWLLLGMCACFVGSFFVQPYIEATKAQLYIHLKNQPFTQAPDYSL